METLEPELVGLICRRAWCGAAKGGL